ncbi:MAG: glycosyltransferase family A protein [Sulfolobales archaeon]
MSKILVVILNKDNADGLKKVLESLVNQVGGCKICECFDVLIVDGNSKDESMGVFTEFQSKYSCIKFRIQEVPGGVGPARLEAVRYALDNGYEYIIWGDSENVYSEDYVTQILSSPDKCEVISGKPLIRCNNLFDKFFYWYHAYHVLFSYVRKKHAPGNNKLVKASVYSKSTYPPIVRSDDFYFSIKALRKSINFCYNRNALVTVALPNDWEGVKSWQRARILGSVQGALLLNMVVPPDFLPWFLFSLYPLYLIVSYSLMLASNIIGYVLLISILTTTLYMILKLGRLSNEVCLNKCLSNPIAGFIGMYMHSLFTVYYTLKYVIKYISKKNREDLIKRSKAITSQYGFSLRDA